MTIKIGPAQIIDPEKVEAALRDCLFTDEELVLSNGKAPEGTVKVDGIMYNFGLHPRRLEEHRRQVVMWLNALPNGFHKETGGGWSFLQGCMQENGLQWGEQIHVDMLFCLGMGLGLVRCQLPRSLWSTLPGGMPYYVIDTADKM